MAEESPRAGNEKPERAELLPAAPALTHMIFHKTEELEASDAREILLPWPPVPRGHRQGRAELCSLAAALQGWNRVCWFTSAMKKEHSERALAKQLTRFIENRAQ